MNQFKITILALVLCLVSATVNAQSFVIERPWKITFEDKKEFSQSEFNDSSWENLTDLKWSDDHKTTANRTLWIRKKVIIPSSLKSEFEKTGLLTLSMGKVLQSDDTYLNGKLIGATGSGDTYRNYLVSKDDILWDKENTIAIRVSHWGSFKISKTPTLMAAAPSNFFAYKTSIKNGDAKAPVQNKDFEYQLEILNKSPKQIAGVLQADFYNFQGTKVHTANKEILLAVGENQINFPYKSGSPFLKIVYTLTVASFEYTNQWNAEYGYENIIYKPVLPIVKYKATQKYFPADLNKIVIDGWLGERLKANTELRLHKVDEEALLAGFINRPGNHSWIGEHVGKFLEAACNAYDNQANPELKNQIDRTAQQLIGAQLADGYLGTYDMDSHWTSWDVWSHRYDLMGLLRYYELTGFKPALASSEKIGNLIMQTFGTEKGQKDIVKAGGHVGMAATCILESMAELYRFSGDKKYLDYCYSLVKSFDNPGGPRIITTLNSEGRVDKVANAKAYEMMSNFLGIVKLYRLTNDNQFLKPIQTAWNDIVKSRLYITGTTSSFEHFQDDHVLPGSHKDNMGEGCVTTTWVQLNYQLFCITGQMKYLDELERSVYNHLTGAENPQTGAVSYYTPLVGKKPFRTVITCCMSSVPRGIAMIPLFGNGKLNNNPAFLLYQPGTYSTLIGNQKITFVTKGNFLKNEKVAISVQENSKQQFPLEFRKPYWASDFTITVNGKKQSIAKEDLTTINRIWKKGDKIEIGFTMKTIVLDGGKSYPNQVALQRGPQVMAFDQSLNNDLDINKLTVNTANIELLPTIYSLPNKWVGTEKFELKATAENNNKNIILVPYADASQTGGVISTWIKTK
ncbi:MAG: glycoside hydrolase family 127 protein [Flavobacterium sp.]|nr:glycoside hydrolase family 127 protein [Flavobacterium sp.]